MLMKKKALLATALTSASLAALAMPTTASAQATANITDECAPAVESSAGLNPEAFDPITGNPLQAGDTIPDALQCGAEATASGNGALAIGNNADAAAVDTTVIGTDAGALARSATAIGARAQAIGENSVAIGSDSIADEDGTVSFGKAPDPVTGLGGVTRRLTNVAAGQAATDAVNVGQLIIALNGVVAGANPLISIDTTTPPVAASASVGSDAIAVGSGSEAAGGVSVAVGTTSRALGDQSVAFGGSAIAQDTDSTALGGAAQALSVRSTAVGASAKADGEFSTAVGASANAIGESATAFGDGARAEGLLTTAFGSDAKVNASDGGIAIGGFADVAANATGSIAFGTNAKVNATVTDAVAIGSDSVADASNTVSVGSATLKRKIVNVANGTAASDAVNKSQLDAATVDDQFIAINTGGVAVAAVVGTGSVAIGSGASAGSSSSVAVGQSAAAVSQQSLAIGQATLANGGFSTAIGQGAKAPAANGLAVGQGAVINNGNLDSIAIGKGATISGAGVTNAIAIGVNAKNSVSDTVSFGAAADAVAGTAQVTRRLTNISGALDPTDATNLAQVQQLISNATGGSVNQFLGVDTTNEATPANAAGQDSVAIGGKAASGGNGSIAIGSTASTLNNNSIAFGRGAKTTEAGTIAMGALAEATESNSVAIGSGAKAFGGSSVAIGALSEANGDNEVSVGNATIKRRIINVANGTAATDAVNRGQLDGSFTTANTALLGVIDSKLTAANAALTGVIDGRLSSTNTAFSAAVEAVVGTLGVGGAGNAFVDVNPNVGAADADASVAGSVAIGGAAVASAANAVALGEGSVADVADTVSVGSTTLKRKIVNVADGTAANDAANIGQLNAATAVNKFVGVNATNFTANSIVGTDAVALGAGTNAAGLRSVAIGSGSITAAGDTDVVSFGGSAKPGGAVGEVITRRLTNVAAGTGDNDAVNVKQLNDKFASVSGGGANPFIVVKTNDATKPAIANGPLAIAIGQNAKTQANTGGGIAIGADANAFRGSVVIGQLAFSNGDQSIAIGGSATIAGDGSNTRMVALGDNSRVEATGSVALGFGSRVGQGLVNENVVSVGSGLAADANTFQFRKIINVADGVATNDAVNFGQLEDVRQIALSAGGGAANIFVDANSSGAGADASVVKSLAIGGDAKASAANAVALGEGSIADAEDTVSVGNATLQRKIVNVKAGTADTDATNLGQVKALIANAGVGGGAGGGVVVPGSVFVAVKEVAGAAPANAAVAGTIALGGNSKALAAETVAVGEGANAAGAKGTAIGSQASAELTNSTAIGAGATVTLTADNSVALGAGSIATEANTVSIGSAKAGDAFATRRLTNVTAGVADTDAANLGQVKAVSTRVDAVAAELNTVKNLVSTGGAGGGFLAVNPTGNAAAATGTGSIALGGNAVASAKDSVAIGTGAVAKDGAAVAIGLGNQASGNGAVAIGDPSIATGQGAVALGFENRATGIAAVAVGSESQAIGDSAFAQGNKAKALGFSALALGDGAIAELQNPTQNSPETFAAANIAIGRGAKATAQTTIAIGNGAVADAEDATVLGDKSRAAFHATAIGGEVVASAAGAQAFGWQTNATGVRSTAVGFRANALADGAMAVGANATVAAGHTNSTAIGIGATTSRADQLVLGRAAGVANGIAFRGTSVTIADIAASTAAQSGPTDVMTVDAFGTIGRDPSIRNTLSNLGGQISNLQKGQEELFDLVSFNRKEARRGIAAASAMTAAPMPSEPGRTSFVAGTAFYRGEGAFSMSFNHRLDLDIPVAFGGGFAHSGGKDTVVRAHVATEF